MLKFSEINYGCFKAVKLVKNVLIVINGVPTSYFVDEKRRDIIVDKRTYQPYNDW